MRYPLVNIPLDAREDTEQLGSKPKFWVLLGEQRWLFNLETAVGRARVGCNSARWQGATTRRACARKEE